MTSDGLALVLSHTHYVQGTTTDNPHRHSFGDPVALVKVVQDARHLGLLGSHCDGTFILGPVNMRSLIFDPNHPLAYKWKMEIKQNYFLTRKVYQNGKENICKLTSQLVSKDLLINFAE